jgi:hypothetical protein
MDIPRTWTRPASEGAVVCPVCEASISLRGKTNYKCHIETWLKTNITEKTVIKAVVNHCTEKHKEEPIWCIVPKKKKKDTVATFSGLVGFSLSRAGRELIENCVATSDMELKDSWYAMRDNVIFALGMAQNIVKKQSDDYFKGRTFIDMYCKEDDAFTTISCDKPNKSKLIHDVSDYILQLFHNLRDDALTKEGTYWDYITPSRRKNSLFRFFLQMDSHRTMRFLFSPDKIVAHTEAKHFILEHEQKKLPGDNLLLLDSSNQVYSNKRRRLDNSVSDNIQEAIVHETSTESTTLTAPVKIAGAGTPPSFLMDAANGDPRYCVIELADDDVPIIEMMKEAFDNARTKKGQGGFGGVSSTMQTLKQYTLEYPGFPVHEPSNPDGFLFEGKPKNIIGEMEQRLTLLVKDSLRTIDYCSSNQKVTWYLSFLYTEWFHLQRPHVDYKWDKITQTKETTPPRMKREALQRSRCSSRCLVTNFKHSIPFIALFPLTKAGMYVEVWKWREKHTSDINEMGVLVHIPYGEILLLHADVVHAGGFRDSQDGNPRAHFYIHKSDGVPHQGSLHNSYDVEIDEGNIELTKFYQHSPSTRSDSFGSTETKEKSREDYKIHFTRKYVDNELLKSSQRQHEPQAPMQKSPTPEPNPPMASLRPPISPIPWPLPRQEMPQSPRPTTEMLQPPETVRSPTYQGAHAQPTGRNNNIGRVRGLAHSNDSMGRGRGMFRSNDRNNNIGTPIPG